MRGADIPEKVEDWVIEAVAATQKGNSEAFGTLYVAYAGSIFRYIYSRVTIYALAEDLTSETFVRALRRITTFSWQGWSFTAWLFAIARNLIADHFKSSRHHREALQGEIREDAKTEPGPEDGILDGIQAHAVHAALHRLTDQQRECIKFRFFQGLSMAETAAIMGKNEAAIKTLQYRAVASLRNRGELKGWLYGE